MKKAVYIYLAVLLLLLAGATAWRLHPVEPEGSELYERYKDVSGVRVGFIRSFPVNDSIAVDVTTVEALTDEGWEWMQDEFQIRRMINVRDSLNPSSDNSNSVYMWNSAPNHPEVWGERLADPGADSNDLCIASHYFRWLAVFQARTEEERDAILIDFCMRQVDSDTLSALPRRDKQ